MGRPKSRTEKKIVVSGYVGESVFRKLAKQAIKDKKSISHIVNLMIVQGQSNQENHSKKEE